MKVTLETRVAVLAAMGNQLENAANNTRKPSQKREGKLLTMGFGSPDSAVPEVRDPCGLLDCASQ